MKVLKLRNALLIMSLFIGLTFSACSSSDNSDDDSQGQQTDPDPQDPSNGDDETSTYILMVTVQVSEDDRANYILTTDDLMTGTLSSEGQGIETLANQAMFTNNKLFAFADGECDVYDYIDDELTKSRTFAFDSNVALVADEANNNMTAFSMPGDLGEAAKIQLFDTEEGFVKKSVDSQYYVPSDEHPEESNFIFAPTSSYLDNNKLFVPHMVWDLDIDWLEPSLKRSYVSVYSYPELEYEKTITADLGGHIGAWYDQPCHLQTENGDHYLMVTNSDPANETVVKSGFAKIKAGEEEFDTSYYYDVQSATGYRIFAGAYAGNNLAVVRVASEDYTDSLWWSDTPPFEMAIINLAEQTFTLVNDVPKHLMQYTTRFLVEDGKVYSNIETVEENYIYRIDPVTATAEKGAKLEVSDTFGLFKVN